MASKRPAAVLLGTSWGVKEQRTGPSVSCRCAACEPRKPLDKSKLAENIALGKGAFYCAVRCGGSRIAGDGEFTKCKRMGRVTVCYGCYKRIDPVWVLDKAARERLLAEGCTYERLVMLNRTKTLEARQPAK